MTRAFRHIRSFGRSNAGSSAVEFAIAAPILATCVNYSFSDSLWFAGHYEVL
jgi:Flp pilus assembly protein TadG